MTASKLKDDEKVSDGQLTDPLLAGAETNTNSSDVEVLPEAPLANSELGE